MCECATNSIPHSDEAFLSNWKTYLSGISFEMQYLKFFSFHNIIPIIISDIHENQITWIENFVWINIMFSENKKIKYYLISKSEKIS